MNTKNVASFDNFGVEYIPKRIRKFIGNENVITKIYRIQPYHSITCGYICIRFIRFYVKRYKFIGVYDFFFRNEFKNIINNTYILIFIIRKYLHINIYNTKKKKDIDTIVLKYFQ